MRFFKTHPGDDEVFVIADPTNHVVLAMARAGDGEGGAIHVDNLIVELEGSSMYDFRRHLCAGCEKDGSNMMDLRSRVARPCQHCPKEVKPR